MGPNYVALVIAAAVAPTALTAQVAPPVAPVSSAKKTSAEAGKMVCRTLDTTGSRLGKKRECRTAAEWAEQSALDRREVERQQANRWKQN